MKKSVQLRVIAYCKKHSSNMHVKAKFHENLYTHHSVEPCHTNSQQLYSPTSIIRTSIIHTLDYLNSIYIAEGNYEVKVQQGLRGHVEHTHAHMILACSCVTLYWMFVVECKFSSPPGRIISSTRTI